MATISIYHIQLFMVVVVLPGKLGPSSQPWQIGPLIFMGPMKKKRCAPAKLSTQKTTEKWAPRIYWTFMANLWRGWVEIFMCGPSGRRRRRIIIMMIMVMRITLIWWYFIGKKQACSRLLFSLFNWMRSAWYGLVDESTREYMSE